MYILLAGDIDPSNHENKQCPLSTASFLVVWYLNVYLCII